MSECAMSYFLSGPGEVQCQRNTRPAPGSFGFERSPINAEAGFHIRLEQALVGFADLLDRDDLDTPGEATGVPTFRHRRRLGGGPGSAVGLSAPVNRKVRPLFQGTSWRLTIKVRGSSSTSWPKT